MYYIGIVNTAASTTRLDQQAKQHHARNDTTTLSTYIHDSLLMLVMGRLLTWRAWFPTVGSFKSHVGQSSQNRDTARGWKRCGKGDLAQSPAILSVSRIVLLSIGRRFISCYLSSLFMVLNLLGLRGNGGEGLEEFHSLVKVDTGWEKKTSSRDTIFGTWVLDRNKALCPDHASRGWLLAGFNQPCLG